MNWIPNYIRKNMQYNPHAILTAKEFNALLNLLITQGDYNSKWLDYLHKEGIPNAVANLNAEQIEKVLKETVAAELETLTASLVHKASARLNTPVFAFLDLSMQADMADFRKVVESYGLPGSFCIATNLVGASSTYPTLTTLRAMQVAGHEILPLGTDGSSYEHVSDDVIYEMLTHTKTYMHDNLTDVDVFVYPGGTESQVAVDTVSKRYTYALNTALEQGSLESDTLREGNTRVQIPVVTITDTNTIETVAVKNIIDDAITTNKCCIIAVDTSRSSYSGSAIVSVIEYIKAHTEVVCTTVSEALELCATTINNQLRKLFDDLAALYISCDRNADEVARSILKTQAHIEEVVLQNCFITEEEVEDADGNTHTEKYLNW